VLVNDAWLAMVLFAKVKVVSMLVRKVCSRLLGSVDELRILSKSLFAKQDRSYMP